MTSISSKSAAYIAARAKLGDHRKVFDSISDALTTLRSIYAIKIGEGESAAAFPSEFPTVAARVGLIDVTGEDTIPPLADWPEEYRNEGVQVCVTFVGVRGLKDETGKEVNGARGFAVYPLHPLAAIQADETGVEWLLKIVEKEASHVALRKLRNVNAALGTDAFAQAAMEMPLSVSDYVEETTAESLDTTAFDKLWKTFRTMLTNNPATAALASRLPQKGEVIKSIRSKAFATEQFEDLEKLGAFKFIGETMAGIIDAMRQQAVEKGEDFELESSEIRGWLATRDTKVFASPKKPEGDLSTVDFAAFLQAVPTPAAGTEGTEGEGASE
jgi:hypothetical protein